MAAQGLRLTLARWTFDHPAVGRLSVMAGTWRDFVSRRRPPVDSSSAGHALTTRTHSPQEVRSANTVQASQEDWQSPKLATLPTGVQRSSEGCFAC